MKTILFVVAALVALAAAVPASSPVHADIYKNTLEAPGARIVNGENAERHEFPYQVSLLWSSSGSGGSHICGGTLVTPTRVITAAHCKAYSYGIYIVHFGLLLRNEETEDKQVRVVKEFATHPGYPGGVAANDIAVIKFDEPVQLTKAVQPLPLASDATCELLEKALLSGWGRTSSWSGLPNHLQKLLMPRISNDRCAEDLIYLLGSSDPLDDSMLCTTSNPGEGQTSCNGDSGGPLARDNELLGVVSWGISPCGYNRAPSVFTKICAHRDFLKQHLE